MRIDRLLCRLRLVKSRSLAHKLVETGHLRCNGQRITRASLPIAVGDVLTIPIGRTVRIIQITAIPERRGPAEEARSCYRALDPTGQTDLAAREGTASKGRPPQ